MLNKLLNKVHCCNCVTFMQQMPNYCIDLIITSPPYGAIRNYNGYVFDFAAVAQQIYRVLKYGGVVVWVVNDQTVDGDESCESFNQALYFKQLGFKLHDTMIWARRTTPQNSNRYEPAFEYMFVLTKGTPKTFNPIKQPKRYDDKRKIKNFHRDADGILGENDFRVNELVPLGNVWDIPNRGSDEIAHKHPAIFPERLAQMHITSWSKEGDIVMDPMCGSGTVCKMARWSNRRFIGIDVSEQYCALARERIKLIPLPKY